MSRPRKPFGANHPGRLPATMLKVLAAEMSDPSRLRRGKQYAKDGSVLDIVIEPGIVTCEIQGTRSTPYVTALRVTQGTGMPLRRDVAVECTCPDDDNFDGYACKHAIAAMFTLSDEFLLEPELLDVWRGNDAAASPSAGAHDTRHDDRAAARPPADEHHGNPADDRDGFDRFEDDIDEDSASTDDTPRGRRRGHLRLVGDDERAPAPITPRQDPLAPLLALPFGAALPEIGRVAPVEPLDPPDRRLADALRDARDHLRLDWD